MRKHRLFTLIYAILIILSLHSCTTYYYIPTIHNVLEFKEKGDVNLATGLTQEESHMSLGYSFTDNIGFISSYKMFRTSPDWETYRVDDYLIENELVIYKHFPENLHLSVNIGYGFGEIDRNNDYHHISFNRQSFLPSLGYISKYFDFAFSFRFSRVNYNLKKYYNYTPGHQTYDNETEKYGDIGKREFYFIEPSFTLGLGYKIIKLRYQYIILNQMGSGQIKYLDHIGSLTLALNFNINRIIKK